MRINYSQIWDLSTIPDVVWLSENGRRNAAKRINAGGIPIMVPCPGCGQERTTRESRKACPNCGDRRRRRQ